MSSLRSKIWTNPNSSFIAHATSNEDHVLSLHKSLPGYNKSPLVHLPAIAKELGVGRFYVKDDSHRFGLPSFKILGASYGTFRALLKRFNLPLHSTIADVKEALSHTPLKLFAATNGNHGQAVAFMATLLGSSSSIFVPREMNQHAKDAIALHGATVIEVPGDYDTAVLTAARKASDEGGVLVQDMSVEGHEEVPRWIVEGYGTIFTELEEQLMLKTSHKTVVIAPVGAGCLAHAVVRGLKSKPAAMKVVTVEPDTASCLYHSLQAGKPVSISTSFTMMTGMNCGTVASYAFQDLKQQVDFSATVSDHECHLAVQRLQEVGFRSGPCGAAGLAAAQRLRADGLVDQDTDIVILNTEGPRPYSEPLDVGCDDVVALTQILTRIESTNTTLSSTTGSGEKAIVDYVEAWLRHRQIETHRLSKDPDRPSLVGVVRGRGNGRSLMINGHIDTVTLRGYSSNPLGGSIEERNGRKVVAGRGALDMKAGVAIGMINLARAKAKGLAGDVILATVADEEDASRGTEELLAAGWRSHAAIIPEPSDMELYTAHKGFVWVEVTILGYAAHGSDPNVGRDAILSTGRFLEALRDFAKTLPKHPFLGQATLHCGTIRGGEENSSYPATCTVTIEFRTLPVQTPESLARDVGTILERLASEDSQFMFSPPSLLFSRPSYALSEEHELVHAIKRASNKVSQRELVPRAASSWCDMALLGEHQIPTIVLGPKGGGLHGKDEYVEVDSIKEVDKIFASFVANFCA